MNIPKMLAGTAVGGTLAFTGFGIVGAVAMDHTPQPPQKVIVQERVVHQQAAPKRNMDRVEQREAPQHREHQSSNAPEAPADHYVSPHKAEDESYAKAARNEPAPQQQNQGASGRVPSGQGSSTQEPSSPESDPKVTTEDGSKVDPEFYSRTDYNRNGVTDQTEPGWNNGAGEEAFKAEGTADYQAWCAQQPATHECHN